MTSKYERHQQVAREQANQQLQNCALLCAYVYGAQGGWYAIAKGSIDGFSCDYAIIHSNPGNMECHPVRAFYLDETESELFDIEEHREAIKQAHEMDELPLVAKFTSEEKEAARLAVREALDEAQPEDKERWLAKLCDGPSDLSFTDWSAVVEAVRK